MLGYLNEQGLYGLSKNDVEAKGYYEQAIAKGSLHALFRLGIMYKEGNNIIPKNEKIANRLLQLACEKGYQAACQ